MDYNTLFKQLTERRSPDLVRGIKIHAKHMAKQEGIGRQAALNRFAATRGHTHWGAYLDMLQSRPRITHEDAIAGVDSALKTGNHLVVRGADWDGANQRVRDIAEALVVRAITDPNHAGQRVFTIDLPGRVDVPGVIAIDPLRPGDTRPREGDVLVVQGGGPLWSRLPGVTTVISAPPHPHDLDIGEYLVGDLDWPLHQGQRMTSSEDRRVFYATIETIRGQVGATTIRRTTPSKNRRQAGEGGMR